MKPSQLAFSLQAFMLIENRETLDIWNVLPFANFITAQILL